MYLDAIQDADAHLSRVDSLNERKIAAEAMYCEIINDAFTKDIQAVSNVSVLSVPMLGGHDGRIKHQSIRSAVEDQMVDDACLDALMLVLQKSPCELVQKLRQTLANRYSYQWAADLAEVAA